MTPGTLQDHYKYSDEHPMVVSVKTQLQRAKQKIGATKTVSKVGKKLLIWFIHPYFLLPSKMVSRVGNKGPLNSGVYAAVLCCVVEAGESSVCVL